MKKIVAGTVILLCRDEVRFLVEKKEEQYYFITREAVPEKTNLGVIVEALKEMKLPMDQLELADLVDVRYEEIQHLPLYVFQLALDQLPPLPSQYEWIGTHRFRELIGKVQFQEITQFYS
ncbi:hypothetical protein [Catellicoccus marimammalium]|uniref:Nudix hydrolase domain-containing protein n=1 Tax=Catellicoccus marimammalium M35/04/3 TaxID=1234409 RepID=K8ZMK8_9ENTE|nr:hypothetical protein [Catellicoccus marimammalium]EKU27778.1 hypothetical protein C683_0243 [Catellicoccus marimammalium M35/04/3]